MPSVKYEDWRQESGKMLLGISKVSRNALEWLRAFLWVNRQPI